MKQRQQQALFAWHLWQGRTLWGMMLLERKLGACHRLHERAGHFQSVVYRDTGHIYLPDMKRRMAAWCERHLPPK